METRRKRQRRSGNGNGNGSGNGGWKEENDGNEEGKRQWNDDCMEKRKIIGNLNDGKVVEMIELGGFEMETWHYSPYPLPYCEMERLFICPQCFGYFETKSKMIRHVGKCKMRHPPGKAIYNENDDLILWKVDGRLEKMYCQNLCLLSRLFLDSKTLFYDVDGFEFFVLVVNGSWIKKNLQRDSFQGNQVVGYYSREKNTTKNLNLACILTLPPLQGCGLGKFLISLSYEISIAEKRNPGAPERPISDLGLRGYQSYWKQAIMRVLLEGKGRLKYGSKELDSISLREISVATGILTQDVTTMLLSMGIVIKYKGRHMFRVRQKDIDEYNLKAKRIKLCNPKYITLH